jgi:hypothetical protein
MLDGITDCYAECKQQYLCNNKERCAKEDIADWPPVVERAEDKNELGDDIDGGADDWPQDIYNPQRYGFRIVETGDLLECGNGDEKSKRKYDEARYPKELGEKNEIKETGIVDM